MINETAIKGKFTLILLLLIICLAAFLRLYKLNEIPPGLYPDVAINANDALDTLKQGPKLFYPENNGREGLFIWLIGVSFLIFGPSVWAIKITAAAVGALTVFGLYLMAKEILTVSSNGKNQIKPEVIALLSAFFIATSFWHLNFSRIGFRVILLPFVLVFCFYFLFRGFRLKKLANFIAAAVFFGLGFYTYTGFRLAVLILIPVLLFFWLESIKQKNQKSFYYSCFWFLAVIFVVSLPIAVYFILNPNDFIGRAAGVSIFSQSNPLTAFLKSFASHLAMFNFSGDYNWRHNFSGAPLLSPLVGIAFIIGFLIAFKRLIKTVKEKNYLLSAPYALIITWFFSMLLVGALTIEAVPHSLRVLGAAPAVFFLAGIGAVESFFWFWQNSSRKKLLIAASVFFVGASFLEQFNLYFKRWTAAPELTGAFSADYLKLGELINSFPEEAKIYVIANQDGVPVPFPNGLPMPAQTPIFMERTEFGKTRATYIKPEQINEIDAGGKTIIVVMNFNDPVVISGLAKTFPQGLFWKTKNFFVFTLNIINFNQETGEVELPDF